ncbi:hypothetical protein BKA70DRAFT_1104235, partial [Coprinopsis sp. MPI-PUGE-AT-0042]
FKSILCPRPADAHVFASWKPSDGPCCDIETFYIDHNGKPASPWNKSAREVFVQGFLTSDNPAIAAANATPADIRRLWVSNFRRYKRSRLGEPNKDELKQQRRRRERRRWVSQSFIPRHARSTLTSLSQLYWRRLRASLRLKETSRYARLVQMYGVDGMSSDESDHGEQDTGFASYRIINKRWRNRQAVTIFRTLDALHRDSRFHGDRLVGPGAATHLRRTGPNHSVRRAVAKLPSTLYCEEWLKKTSDFEQCMLEVGPPVELDLSIDPDVIECVMIRHFPASFHTDCPEIQGGEQE